MGLGVQSAVGSVSDPRRGSITLLMHKVPVYSEAAMRQQKREKMNEREILEKIKKAYSEILKENMVGIYVHGSIAFRCFNWDKSDIDFIVVAKRPLALSEKEALIRVILSLDPVCPPKGIEMSVVLAEVCRPFVYPTPYELHFSNAHKQRYQENLSGYCEKLQGVDMDLAAHFTVIRAWDASYRAECFRGFRRSSKRRLSGQYPK